MGTLTELGDLNIKRVLAIAQPFVLLLYGQKSEKKCRSLSELREKLASTTDKPKAMLSSTEDAVSSMH